MRKGTGPLGRLAALLVLLAMAAMAAPESGAERATGLRCRAGDGRREAVFAVAAPHLALDPGQSVHPQLGPAFTARWEGGLRIDRAGSYTLRAEPARIYLDDAEAGGRAVALAAGVRRLRIELDRPAGPVRLRLEWESEHFPREPVPSAVLSLPEEGSPAGEATTRALERGRLWFETYRCAACHDSGPLLRPPPGSSLDGAGDRFTAAWMHRWLEHPDRLRDGAAMPALPLGEQDRADLVAWLDGLRTAGGPAPAPGRNLSEAAAGEGRALFERVGCAACHSEPALALEGTGAKWKSPGALAAFLRNPLRFHPDGRMPDQALRPEEADALAAWLMRPGPADGGNETGRTGPAGDPVRGLALARSGGCLNCHSVSDDKGRVKGTMKAAPLAALARADAGCLADAAVAPAPRFAFAPGQREDLRAFVASPDLSAAPARDLERLVTSLRCASCHERDGVAPAHLPPGPLPPSLTLAGDKLRPAWLERVLGGERKRIRPWLDLRMPHYGGRAAELAAGLAAATGRGPGEEEEKPGGNARPSLEEMRRGVARLGIGEGGLGCIQCHDFRDRPAISDLRGPDLTEMGARLRDDWLRRWLRDPQRISPGTAMPAFFSALPAAEAEAGIDLLRRTLASGPSLPVPPGYNLDGGAFTLSPVDAPMVERVFLLDASERAIAVGLPEAMSFCFDAESARLRYAWSGGFLDMEPVWNKRGGMPARILGEKFFEAPEGFPLRFGDGASSEARFLGYRLEGGKAPEFRYQMGGVEIHETLVASAEGARPGLLRRIRVGAVEAPVWFQAGAGREVRVGGRTLATPRDGWVRVAGQGPVEFEMLLPLPGESDSPNPESPPSVPSPQPKPANP